MLVRMTKKEFDATIDVVKSFAKEFEETEILDVFDLEEFEEGINAAKAMKIKYDAGCLFYQINEKGVLVKIDEELFSDLVHMVYQPTIVTIAKWMINTIKTFSSLFEKVITPAVEFINGKFHLDDAEVDIDMGDDE